MGSVESAVEAFQQGCNCAQATCVAFGPEEGLAHESCLAVASAFGAGMARHTETCGAVTGALMRMRSPLDNGRRIC